MLLLLLAIEVQVTTLDGQRIRGTLEETSIRWRRFSVPLARVRRIEPALVEGDGFRLVGPVGWREVRLRTKFGPLRIPMREILSIEVGGSGGMGEQSIELADGTEFSGTVLDDGLSLRTRYGPIDVRWSRVVAFERLGSDVRIAGRTAAVAGLPLTRAIAVESVLGRLVIPISEIVSIRRRSARANLALSGKAFADHAPHFLVDGVYDKVEGSNYFAWCTVGGSMTVELASLSRVDEIRVHLWNGDARLYGYRLEVSADGVKWETLTERSGAKGLVVENFRARRIRFVRIHGLANNVNSGFHLLELEVFGY